MGLLNYLIGTVLFAVIVPALISWRFSPRLGAWKSIAISSVPVPVLLLAIAIGYYFSESTVEREKVLLFGIVLSAIALIIGLVSSGLTLFFRGRSD